MSTDRKDQVSSLSARDDLLFIADRWPRLAALVGGSTGNALTGLPGAASIIPPLVIDIEIVNLMNDIETNVARYYGHILMDETDWTPATSAMPALLADVAMRYGHFTADEDLTIGFCADAKEYREKVRKVLDHAEPKKYIGSCRTKDCAGELYVGDGETAGVCHACGISFTTSEQRSFIGQQFDTQLMTATDIGLSLKCMGYTTQPTTVRTWVKRLRLMPDRVYGPLTLLEYNEVPMYRIADAKALAEKPRKIAA